MTKPPCKPDGVECTRRYVGCRAVCEQYHEWLIQHEAELQNKREYNNRNRIPNDHVIDLCIRLRKRRNRQ